MLTYTTTIYTTATGLYRKPVTSNPYPFKINFNIALPSTPTSVNCVFLTLRYKILCVFLTSYEYKFHFFFFGSWLNSPQWVRVSSISRLYDHTQTHHTR